MKGGGITGGAGASSVTPFMLQNLTKSLNAGKEGESGGVTGRRERERKRERAVVEQERERETVRLRQEQLRCEAEKERRDGVVVCRERSGGVQWKYVTKEGRTGEKALHVMHAKQHRDPVAVGYFSAWIENGVGAFYFLEHDFETQFDAQFSAKPSEVEVAVGFVCH